jgi:hypothetical protein
MQILLVKKNNEWSSFFPLLSSTDERLRAELLALLSGNSDRQQEDVRNCESVPNDILETCNVEEAVIIELLDTDISGTARFYAEMYRELRVEYAKLLAIRQILEKNRMLKDILDDIYPTNGFGLVPK